MFLFSCAQTKNVKYYRQLGERTKDGGNIEIQQETSNKMFTPF